MQKQQQTYGSSSDEEKAIGVMDPNYVDWVLSLYLRLLWQHTRERMPCPAHQRGPLIGRPDESGICLEQLNVSDDDDGRVHGGSRPRSRSKSRGRLEKRRSKRSEASEGPEGAPWTGATACLECSKENPFMMLCDAAASVCPLPQSSLPTGS